MLERHLPSETHAIALRKVRFSDSGLVVTWLAKGCGLLRTSVRGALRPGSPVFGSVDLFHETRIFWTPARRGDLHTLKEAEVLRAFRPCEPAHVTLLAAAYFAELILQTVQPEEPMDEVFDLIIRALTYLSQQPPAPRVVLHFENELSRLLGIFSPERAAAEALREYIGNLPPQRTQLLAGPGG